MKPRTQPASKTKQAARRRYELANGRYVETIIGKIAIAPPVAPRRRHPRSHIPGQEDLINLLASIDAQSHRNS